MTSSDYFQHVVQAFRQQGNPDIAQVQMEYMHHQYEFFGLRMPVWMALTREIHRVHDIPRGAELQDLARRCFADDHRELHYFALETVQKVLKKQPADFIDFLEELILSQSWWDTVHWLAKLVGLHFLQYPTLTRPVTERWLASGNVWLQCVCLLFQLRFKEKTDPDLLFHYVRQLAASPEVYLQKGAGWALREYSKIDPTAVEQFIASTPLAPLTRREGLKWIKTKGKRG